PRGQARATSYALVVELADAGHDVPLLHVRDLTKDRQGTRVGRPSIRDLEPIRCAPERREAFLLMEGHGIVDLRADVTGRQVRAQRVAIRTANHELVVNV